LDQQAGAEKQHIPALLAPSSLLEKNRLHECKLHDINGGVGLMVVVVEQHHHKFAMVGNEQVDD
jgi:hypothetical protein